MANPVAGQLLRIKNTDTTHTGFQDVNGTLMDPTTVTLVVKDPTGARSVYTTATTPAVVKDSVGVYHLDLDTTGKAGTWSVEWQATGTGQATSLILQFAVDAAL